MVARGRRCGQRRYSFVIVSRHRASHAAASNAPHCSWAVSVDTRRASIVLSVASFPGLGVVRNCIASAVMMGCVIVTPANSEGPAPGVKKPGGPDPKALKPV